MAWKPRSNALIPEGSMSVDAVAFASEDADTVADDVLALKPRSNAAIPEGSMSVDAVAFAGAEVEAVEPSLVTAVPAPDDV